MPTGGEVPLKSPTTGLGALEVGAFPAQCFFMSFMYNSEALSTGSLRVVTLHPVSPSRAETSQCPTEWLKNKFEEDEFRVKAHTGTIMHYFIS